ncbi:MAG TPA: family 1 encapsulin nanocompartment shell protein, partial [Acidimicrobiia bacterium]|nr:family 1 encapsulin nanocompartment shell protein [Acidimicrobiia bacterium]
PPVTLSGDYAQYPGDVARAVETLLEAGVQGPYGLALGPDAYTGVVETTEHGGILVFDHLRQILGGPIVWAPGVDGAVVVSQRGGDFLFESGEDLAVGYDRHDAERAYLYFEESFTFHVASPEAGIALAA